MCVCVGGCVFEKRNGLLYHRHPDTAGIESERQWRAAKETNRLSWPLRELWHTVIIRRGGVGGWRWWGGSRGGSQSMFVFFYSANKGDERKNSGAAEEDKTGKMKSLPLDPCAHVMITAVFSLFHNKPTTTFHCKCSTSCLSPTALPSGSESRLAPFYPQSPPCQLFIEIWALRISLYAPSLNSN